MNEVMMKDAAGNELLVVLAENAGAGKGKRFLPLDTSTMVVDIGSSTADAVLQADGSWEVDGLASADLISEMAVSAERLSRKVSFLPRQVERKVARSVHLALARTGQVILGDGTVIRRSRQH
ncbi:hypothetical protein ACSVIJ_04665 [Pseudomonas sp. NCHU5208]|uniref:hypothetical protein n=1 Tax=unclassified Pseudomonas TaxID=196821 RepID=UPI003F98A9EE